jgi:hypothetical protein
MDQNVTRGEHGMAGGTDGVSFCAARTLGAQQERWLNPPERIELLAAKIDAADTNSRQNAALHFAEYRESGRGRPGSVGSDRSSLLDSG